MQSVVATPSSISQCGPRLQRSAHLDRLQARANVIHEVGLFQGRLGFERAIVLLEEGCEEFSNITGITQIRFPPGNVGAKFEEIRRVLERENILRS